MPQYILREFKVSIFVVDPLAEYNMPQYILREFKVSIFAGQSFDGLEYNLEYNLDTACLVMPLNFGIIIQCLKKRICI